MGRGVKVEERVVVGGDGLGSSGRASVRTPPALEPFRLQHHLLCRATYARGSPNNLLVLVYSCLCLNGLPRSTRVCCLYSALVRAQNRPEGTHGPLQPARWLEIYVSASKDAGYTYQTDDASAHVSGMICGQTGACTSLVQTSPRCSTITLHYLIILRLACGRLTGSLVGCLLITHTSTLPHGCLQSPAGITIEYDAFQPPSTRPHAATIANL